MKHNATSKPLFSAEQIASALSAAPEQSTGHDDEPLSADWKNAIVSHSLDELRAKIEVRQTRGKNRQPTKEQIAIRFSPEVLAAFRASGKGWQTRMDEALKEWLKTHSSVA
jgi:uncharacterized protein (DUF4415 family)